MENNVEYLYGTGPIFVAIALMYIATLVPRWLSYIIKTLAIAALVFAFYYFFYVVHP